jgi:hypothetical protein
MNRRPGILAVHGGEDVKHSPSVKAMGWQVLASR